MVLLRYVLLVSEKTDGYIEITSVDSNWESGMSFPTTPKFAHQLDPLTSFGVKNMNKI